MQIEERVLRGAVYCYRNNGENIADFKWQRRWIIIGRYERKSPMAYYGGNAIAVDLNGLRSTNKILLRFRTRRYFTFELNGCEIHNTLLSGFPDVGALGGNTQWDFANE